MRIRSWILCISLAARNCKAARGGIRLQRILSTFPRGLAGAGLLLLRIAVGVILFVQGTAYHSCPVYRGRSLLQHDTDRHFCVDPLAIANPTARSISSMNSASSLVAVIALSLTNACQEDPRYRKGICQ